MSGKYNEAVEETLLGGLSPGVFLRRHWQKRPLLVRGALRNRVPLSPQTLASLAGRDDVEARLVQRRGARWTLEHGPFTRARLARMPARAWTLLVQGVNHHVAEAEQLLRRFAFVPQARLDDVMASYAAPGGGVGPHWDSYDVFLVQTHGHRIWRLCRPRPFQAVPGAPLRIIEGFVREDEYLLGPGDLLYLPPGWGHDGVALDACITCSIGFRTPSGPELTSGFLDYLAERGLAGGGYRDPDLQVARQAARIGEAMQGKVHAQLARLRWTRRDTASFLGAWLTSPKPHVVFDAPARPLGRARFSQKLARGRLRLDPKTLMLHDRSGIYLNGEQCAVPSGQRRAFRALADARQAEGRRFTAAAARDLVYDWYRSGFLHLA